MFFCPPKKLKEDSLIQANTKTQGPWLKDIIGLQAELSELETLMRVLKDPSIYEAYGASMPKGIILHGPPGTGKTMIAKAFKNETGLPFFPLDAGDVMYHDNESTSLKRLSEVFKKASEQAPSVIFIDEIDTFLGLNMFGPGDTTTLNHLLKLMDGFYPTERILILAATNDIQKLPTPLLRPGRFDKHLALPLPDEKAIQRAVLQYTRAFKLSPTLKLKRISDVLSNLTIAEVKHISNEIIMTLIQIQKNIVEETHLLDALDRYHLGLHQIQETRQGSFLKRIAYHEAAHAVLHQVFGSLEEVARISIVSHTHTQGHVRVAPIEQYKEGTHTQLKERLVVLLAGYAAEQHFFGETSAGCAEDLRQSSDLATNMVRYYGMSDLHVPRSFVTGEHFMARSLSESLEAKLDENINTLLLESLDRAKQLVMLEEERIKLVAEALLEKRVLVLDEFRALLQQPTIN